VIIKIDLDSKLDESKINSILPDKVIIKVSIKTGEFVDKIEKTIEDMFFKGHFNVNNDILITNVRHKDLLEKCFKSLKQALDGLNQNMPVDCVSIDLKNSLDYLGQITGESVNDDIIHEIFKQFCVGK
jgi:tRNA modification GTPase